MRDCTTNVLAAYIRCLRQLGAPVDELVDGLAVDLAVVENPRNWLDWETMAEILARMESRMGCDDVWPILTDDLVERRSVGRVVNLAVSPHNLYRLTACVLAPRVLPIHAVRWCTDRGRRVRIVMDLPRYRVGCESLFRSTHALYVDLPRVMGLPRAQVESTIGPHHSEFFIDVPASRTFAARTRRAVHAMLSGEEAIKSLIDNKEVRALPLLEDPQQAPPAESARVSEKLDALGRLAGGVAHDLNNILMSIGGYADLVRAEVPQGSDGHRLLDELGHAVDRGSVLATQLLAFSRREHLRPRNLDVNQVVESQMRLLRRLLSGLTIRIELAPKLETVHIDPGQLKQVLVNLAVNARDAMPAGGIVTIKTEAAADGQGRALVRISVHDDGHGMSPEVVSRIFEPFFSTKGGAGTGLGLATVNAIVQEMGGQVHVRSVAGHGTTFDVDLPTISAAPEPVVGQPWTEDRPPRGSETVLLVEDEEMLRRILSVALERAGYNVLTARGLEDALAVVNTQPRLDLVVSDVMLGPDRGTDVVTQVLAAQPQARRLLISGAVDPDQDPLVRNHPFLKKPFSNTELLLRIRELLDEPPNPAAP